MKIIFCMLGHHWWGPWKQTACHTPNYTHIRECEVCHKLEGKH